MKQSLFKVSLSYYLNLFLLFFFWPKKMCCSLGGPGIVAASGVGLLYISAGLAVWSLVVYMSKIWRVLTR